MRIAGLSEHRHLERTLRPRDPIVPGPRPVERRSRHVNAVRRRRWRRGGEPGVAGKGRALANPEQRSNSDRPAKRRASLQSSVSRNARPSSLRSAAAASSHSSTSVVVGGRSLCGKSASSTSVRALRLRSQIERETSSSSIRRRCRHLAFCCPRLGRDYPPNLSISLSGGKETNRDSLSNGE